MSTLPAERTLRLEGDDDALRVGYTVEVTPRAIVVLFAPSYWRRVPGPHDAHIQEVCEGIGAALRRVLAEHS